MNGYANVEPVQELLAAVLIQPQYFGILTNQRHSSAALAATSDLPEYCLNAADKDWDSCEDDD